MQRDVQGIEQVRTVPFYASPRLLRPGLRDAKLANLYLVGAGTHPGAGLAAVLAGAKAAAKLMLETTT